MTSVATLQPEPARIVACTISRDVQAFAQLIDAMEDELGEEWGGGWELMGCLRGR